MIDGIRVDARGQIEPTFRVPAVRIEEGYMEPAGIEPATSCLQNAPDDLGAERGAIRAGRLGTLYVRDLDDAARALSLRRVDAGTNVVFATGNLTSCSSASSVEGLRIAAFSQVAVDLLTGSGCNPSEASALLDWMQSNESSWRSSP